jgi:hydrogenase maturation protease
LSAPRIRLVGCGSPDAGDDAIGLVLASQLRERLLRDVEVKISTAGGANLLDWCDGVETLIIVDAALATESFPVGQWRAICYPAERAALKTLASPSTHSLGVGEALELAHGVGCLPPEVVVFAVAGSQFELGAGLSSVLEESLPTLLAAVESEVRHHLGTPKP